MPFSRYIGAKIPRNPLLPPITRNKTYCGFMNWKSVSKLRFAINLLVAQAELKEVYNPSTHRYYKFKINFITLTLSAPQLNVSDRTIKSKMLEPFLRNLRNVYKLKSYVWRAERQKNGNLHFHITTDTYIDYAAIRDAWNHQQAKFHFIEMFRNKNKTAYPNSTDVHAVKTIRDIARYLSKYMAKAEKDGEKVEGKLWDCSKNLKPANKPTYELTASVYGLIGKLKKEFPQSFVETDHCTIINYTDHKIFDALPRLMKEDYLKWLYNVRANA
jgi:hypothetical protein